MSHDQKKDTTFNQKYAGRSRVRRDLNTIKSDVVNAGLVSTANLGTGKTFYDLQYRLGGGMHAAYFTIGNNLFSAGADTMNGSYGSTSGAHTGLTWSQLTNTESYVCLFRGIRDITGSGVTTHTGQVIHVWHVEMQLEEAFVGSSVTDLSIDIGAAGMNEAGNRYPNDSGVLEGCYIAETGQNLVTDDVGNIYPGSNNQNTAGFEAGLSDRYKNRVRPRWTDSLSSGPSSGLSGVGIVGTGIAGSDTAGNYYSGVWAHLKSTGANLSVISAGSVGITIWFTVVNT